LEGKVLDSKTLKVLPSAVVTVQNTTLLQLTTSEGAFFFPNVPVGKNYVSIKAEGYESQLLEIEVKAKEGYNMGEIILKFDLADDVATNLITLSENDLADDDAGGGDNTAGLLQASRDAYQQAAAFSWNLGWFRIRGLDNELSHTLVNGITMNKINTGRPQWANWGGLNDATRNQEFTMGSGPSDYVFGSILGTQNINTRASFYRKGTRANLAMTNTNYTYRGMFTHASGLNKQGWAYTISGSRRWAPEANFPGTDYEGNSFLISIEKKINDNHSLNITSIYAQHSRGRNSFNTEEVNDIMGVTYNSFWGFQDGKKRNSRVRSINEPFTTLSHYWKINSKTKLNTNVSYQFGRFADSRLDFQNVLNPDPTYYRNLPSYALNYGTGAPNFVEYQNQLGFFQNNSQINWNNLYRANQADAALNPEGKSVYVAYEDVAEDKQWTVNSILSAQLADNILMNGSVNYRNLRSHQFAEITDLLGGNFFRDVDLFQPIGFQDSDMNNPNRNVVKGDKYAYNFIMHANIIDAFTQFKFRYDKVDFYLAQNFSRTQYQREGLFRNPVYKDQSFGKSEVVEFNNYGFKGGMTYKITGRHLVDFNAAHLTKAPVMRTAFGNARMNNVATPNINSEEISSLDVSYIIRAPRLKARLTAFYNETNNATQISFFFQEGGNDNDEFVQEILSGVKRTNKGLEFGLDYQLSPTLSLKSAANFAEYLYANNPNIAVNVDDSSLLNDGNPNNLEFGFNNYGKSFLKNYRANSAPERAYMIGLEYRNPKFWWIGADMNMLTHRFLGVSPLLRTESFIYQDIESQTEYPGATEENVRRLLRQERLEDMFILNIRGGKTWRTSTKNRNTIGIFASVNNALGNRYKTGGFEQARKANYTDYALDNQPHTFPNGLPVRDTRTFGPRYFYSFGATFFVNLTYNF
jgi:hypothetical protein